MNINDELMEYLYDKIFDPAPYPIVDRFEMDNALKVLDAYFQNQSVSLDQAGKAFATVWNAYYQHESHNDIDKTQEFSNES
jgi:hypothetical protein